MWKNLEGKEEETRKLEEEIDDEEEEEEEEDGDSGEDWNGWDAEEDDSFGEDSDFLCLFCDSKFDSSDSVFEHCRGSHCFDFHIIGKELGLDFYGSFKLINYVRSQVAKNKCWSCQLAYPSKQELLDHLHQDANLKDVNFLFDDDKYLNPFMSEDPLLYSFHEDENEDDSHESFNKEELLKNLNNFGDLCIIDENSSVDKSLFLKDGERKAVTTFSENGKANGTDSVEDTGLNCRSVKDEHQKVYTADASGKDIKKVNESYFGSYSSFGIHRDMIGDQARTDAYRKALVQNPSLLNGAVVMDIGCGTGILSLFAAQAGALRVIAVEASEKMSAVASQIAKDNGLYHYEADNEGSKQSNGVIEIVNTMAEDLDKSFGIQPNNIDIIISEWMGYCLLYESMLSSVLFARDRWLKPGGAILPDTATIFVAGFGKGATSLPFWENVYGFNMSCIGVEVARDAAKIPIVDVVNDNDIVTTSSVLHAFDIATMKPDEVDFTATAELEPKTSDTAAATTQLDSDLNLCYGVVLWFDTGFTSRFCKETPVVLSTSPKTQKTHWCQTLLTFQEPILMASDQTVNQRSTAGMDASPAARIHLRISIARAAQHRCIDISLETSVVDLNGRKRKLPVQTFNMS